MMINRSMDANNEGAIRIESGRVRPASIVTSTPNPLAIVGVCVPLGRCAKRSKALHDMGRHTHTLRRCCNDCFAQSVPQSILTCGLAGSPPTPRGRERVDAGTGGALLSSCELVGGLVCVGGWARTSPAAPFLGFGRKTAAVGASERGWTACCWGVCRHPKRDLCGRTPFLWLSVALKATSGGASAPSWICFCVVGPALERGRGRMDRSTQGQPARRGRRGSRLRACRLAGWPALVDPGSKKPPPPPAGWPPPPRFWLA